MKISVITVCRNAAGTIGHTLDSFFAQHHSEKELVVIDGGSTDGTADIVRAAADGSVRLVSEPDEGLYDAANKGLRLFSGDAVGFLNADDRYHDRDVLARIGDALSTAEIVYGNLDFVRDHSAGHVVRQWRGSSFRKGSFRLGWMPAHPTFYVRRAVADAVGPFDLSYRTAADYDWMLRACELHDFRCAFLDRVMVDMMAGGQSTRSFAAHVHHNLEALRSRRKWIGAGMLDFALLAKPLRKATQFAAPFFESHESVGANG